MVELLLLLVVNLVYRVPYDPSKCRPYHFGPADEGSGAGMNAGVLAEFLCHWNAGFVCLTFSCFVSHQRQGRASQSASAINYRFFLFCRHIHVHTYIHVMF